MSKAIKLLLICATLTFTAVQVQAFPGRTAQQGATPPANATFAAPSGKVVETMNASGYTYLCVEADGQKTWAAIPTTQVKVGDEVSLASGMVMHNFTSQSLHRTFPEIVFSRGITKK